MEFVASLSQLSVPPGVCLRSTVQKGRRSRACVCVSAHVSLRVHMHALLCVCACACACDALGHSQQPWDVKVTVTHVRLFGSQVPAASLARWQGLVSRAGICRDSRGSECRASGLRKKTSGPPAQAQNLEDIPNPLLPCLSGAHSRTEFSGGGAHASRAILSPFPCPLPLFSLTSGRVVSFDAYFQPGRNCERSVG